MVSTMQTHPSAAVVQMLTPNRVKFSMTVVQVVLLLLDSLALREVIIELSRVLIAHCVSTGDCSPRILSLVAANVSLIDIS